MLHDFVQLIHLLFCTFIDLSLSDLYLLTVFTFGPYSVFGRDISLVRPLRLFL